MPTNPTLADALEAYRTLDAYLENIATTLALRGDQFFARRVEGDRKEVGDKISMLLDMASRVM